MQKSVMFFMLIFLGTNVPSFSSPFTLLLCLQTLVKGGDQPLCNLYVIWVAYNTLL